MPNEWDRYLTDVNSANALTQDAIMRSNAQAVNYAQAERAASERARRDDILLNRRGNYTLGNARNKSERQRDKIALENHEMSMQEHQYNLARLRKKDERADALYKKNRGSRELSFKQQDEANAAFDRNLGTYQNSLDASYKNKLSTIKNRGKDIAFESSQKSDRQKLSRLNTERGLFDAQLKADRRESDAVYKKELEDINKSVSKQDLQNFGYETGGNIKEIYDVSQHDLVAANDLLKASGLKGNIIEDGNGGLVIDFDGEGGRGPVPFTQALADTVSKHTNPKGLKAFQDLKVKDTSYANALSDSKSTDANYIKNAKKEFESLKSFGKEYAKQNPDRALEISQKEAEYTSNMNGLNLLGELSKLKNSSITSEERKDILRRISSVQSNPLSGRLNKALKEINVYSAKEASKRNKNSRGYRLNTGELATYDNKLKEVQKEILSNVSTDGRTSSTALESILGASSDFSKIKKSFEEMSKEVSNNPDKVLYFDPYNKRFIADDPNSVLPSFGDATSAAFSYGLYDATKGFANKIKVLDKSGNLTAEFKKSLKK